VNYLVVSVSLCILDQVTKRYMSSLLDLCVPGRCESIHVLPVFKLTLHHNTGAAFSFLSDAGGWQRWFLVAVSTVVTVAVVAWLLQVHREQRLLAVALALIVGGAAGNLVDRVLLGYVVDFVVLYYDAWYFPAFNVADAAISVGAGLMILDMLKGRRMEAVDD
jgi:signal peptidase II